MNEIIKPVFESVLSGNAGAVKSGVEAALSAGMEPAAILNEGLIAAMSEVGRRFEEGEYFVPEMLIAARAMKEGLALLKSRLLEADVQPAGKVVLGTVRGDMHDIGKNLVGMMLEGAGFEVLDLGTDVTAEKFIAAARAGNADLIGLSALLTTTMPNMKTTIQALKSAGLAGKVKVIVGGAPVTEVYARGIGADGYAPDASRAAALARSLLAG